MGDYETSKDGFHFFWKGILSQWYPSPFTVDGVEYPTAEHWMMAEKARLFEDKITLDEILKSGSPKLAKDWGRRVAGFNQKVWDSHCFDIVVQGNLHKFTQNPDLKGKLLGTGHKILVEASSFDTIWGIGLAQDDFWATNPAVWPGKNLLGLALMKVRNQLQETP
jgi:ribA/ribD-fused uncharacterized protein